MPIETLVLDDKVRALLLKPNFAHVATVRRDGSGSVTPIWIDYDGEHVLLNGMLGRAWPRNLARDPRVTVSVSALENPYECATIRGRALEPTIDDAGAHFAKLFKKYRDIDLPRADQPGASIFPGRVLFRVAAESVHYQWQPQPGAHEEYQAFLAKSMASPVFCDRP